jgi:hypothetical protein
MQRQPPELLRHDMPLAIAAGRVGSSKSGIPSLGFRVSDHILDNFNWYWRQFVLCADRVGCLARGLSLAAPNAQL